MPQSEKTIIAYLKKRAKKENPFETSHAEIVKRTGLCLSTVKIQMNLLTVRGVIKRTYRRTDRKQVVMFN